MLTVGFMSNADIVIVFVPWAVQTNWASDAAAICDAVMFAAKEATTIFVAVAPVTVICCVNGAEEPTQPAEVAVTANVVCFSASILPSMRFISVAATPSALDQLVFGVCHAIHTISLRI
jgi:hypothetical protein